MDTCKHDVLEESDQGPTCILCGEIISRTEQNYNKSKICRFTPKSKDIYEDLKECKLIAGYEWEINSIFQRLSSRKSNRKSLVCACVLLVLKMKGIRFNYNALAKHFCTSEKLLHSAIKEVGLLDKNYKRILQFDWIDLLESYNVFKEKIPYEKMEKIRDVMENRSRLYNKSSLRTISIAVLYYIYYKNRKKDKKYCKKISIAPVTLNKMVEELESLSKLFKI